MKETKSKKDELILKVIFVVLIIHNLIYAISKFFPNYSPGFLMDFHNYYQDNKVFISILELVLVSTILVDTILTFDKLKQPKRFFFLTTVVLFVMAFIFKAFIGYLEAVFNFPS